MYGKGAYAEYAEDDFIGHVAFQASGWARWPVIESHNDEARFWREIGPILDGCNGDQGFCVGLICAAAILNSKAPYPVRDVLLLAAEKDRRAFFDAMVRGVRKTRKTQK